MTYVYPFTSHATTGRIDQGQDFGGTGPIVAIGNAKIIKTGAPGWPGGAGVLYQLLDGPRRGHYVFVYEGIRPSVRAGEVVSAGQKIGALIPGSKTGIEIGFADASGVPLSHSEYTEGMETVHGKEMARFLARLKKNGGEAGLRSIAEETVNQGLFPHSPHLSAEELPSKVGEAAGGVAASLLSGLADLLGEKAPRILLNIGLVGGGAFFLYFGVARMVGVGQPARTPLRAVQGAAIAGAEA